MGTQRSAQGQTEHLPGERVLPCVDVSARPIEYHDTGGPGPPVVLVHGLLMDGAQWRHVVGDLSRDHRCVLAIIIGGATRERQFFNTAKAGLLSTLLILVVIALLLPAVFDYTGRIQGHASNLRVTDEELGLGASAVLIVLYVANLAYTLTTHRDVFVASEPRGKARWSLGTSLGVIVAATAVIAVEAEMVSGALTETADVLHLSPLFIGVIVLGLVGTIAAARRFLVRSSGQDGARPQYLHQLRHSGGARRSSSAGHHFVADGPSDEPGILQPLASLRHCRNGVNRQRDLPRW